MYKRQVIYRCLLPLLSELKTICFPSGEKLAETSLRGDVFPNLENPFSNLPEPTLGAAASLPGLPPMPNPALVNNAQFGNIDPVSRLTLAEETYLSPLEQSYRKKQRTT